MQSNNFAVVSVTDVSRSRCAQISRDVEGTCAERRACLPGSRCWQSPPYRRVWPAPDTSWSGRASTVECWCVHFAPTVCLSVPQINSSFHRINVLRSHASHYKPQSTSPEVRRVPVPGGGGLTGVEVCRGVYTSMPGVTSQSAVILSYIFIVFFK